MTQDMTHRTSNKNRVRIPAMRARMALVGLVLFLSGGNAVAQEGEGSGGSTTPPTTGVVVHGNVFGGGNLANVGGTVVVNMSAGTVDKDVYGGGALANTNTNNWNADGEGYELVSGLTAGTSVVTGLYTKSGESYTEITEANKTAEENTDYYKKVGAWAEGMYNTTTGATTNTTTVNLTGGTINGDAYGGGLGRIAESVHYTQEEADAYNSEHNLSSGNEGFKTTADWLPEVKATVYGDINVILGKDDASSATKFYINKYTDEQHAGMVKSGRVFGCNNLNGSPQGNVTVTVWKTTEGNTPRSETADKNNPNATYEVAAVYGGGNLANYAPTASGKKSHVIIYGCSDTSIEYVYGGGNAAAVPQSSVDVNAAYEIGYVFGGGNGKDDYTLDGSTWQTNPGANVNGNANTMLFGGTIHEAFGGSNEKGRITGTVSINSQNGDSESENYCALKLGKLYGAGKNADIDGDLIVVMGCMPGDEDPTTEVYGGAENANVKGDVELTITSGSFRKVFGGNNQSGAIFGHIKLNIEESGCTPIKIDELYLGGYNAPYSVYGYKNTGTADAPVYVARTNKEDGTAVFFDFNPHTKPNETSGQYDDPELNIISATRIGKVFGGGLGSGAIIYGNPIVNINQTYPFQFDATTKNYVQKTTSELGAIGVGYKDENNQDVEGGIFGGGNEAAVYGNTTVNIGNKATVDWTVLDLNDSGQPKLDGNERPISKSIPNVTVLGANIASNVYGGGNLADVTGNTQVNICAKYNETTEKWESVSYGSGLAGVTIGLANVAETDRDKHGNVFGGGKGEADTFTCEKAMVGEDGKGTEANYLNGNTHIIIGNGTVYGNVYGGGEIGRVEMNTSVTIGLGDGVASGTVTSAPEIQHSVFGGGKGLETHGYSALVRGNPTVIIQGNAKVRDNVYGGGQIASVARYNVAKTDDEGAPYGVKKDEPYALKANTSGFCSVTIRGNAVIGPETIASDVKTTTVGHVFGAGKGILPAFIQGTTKRMVAVRDDEGHITGSTWDDFTAGEADYITFVKTLALASQTNVTIDGNALVKGSVFGGSESGFVQFDTNVNVSGGTIGTEGKGGADFGNVYGGGKGDVEYTGEHENYVAAGIVKGNTKVVISQASGKTTKIYHNVYGGGAYGTVGEFEYDTTTGMPTARKTYIVDGTEHSTTGGKAEIYITGGTIGTNGNENGMIFGSSRGDVGAPGSIHDKAAWVYDTHVAIGDTIATTTTTATPLIKGSVYGGGENGHNFHSSYVRINGGTIGITSGEAIGSYTNGGASYPYRGNVYGGGCGTDMYDSNNDDVKDSYNPLAGIVRGDATIRMTAGRVVHNMYGAGAMGSVGNFEKNTTTNVITFNSGGTTTIAISGGTIGVDGTAGEGNVYGAARGDVAVTDRNLALVKETSVTISGTSTQIKGNVYGGGEVGNVQTNTTVDIQGGAIAKNVYGGGKGVEDLFTCEQAMVGVEGEGTGANLDTDDNKIKGTSVTVSNGMVGTLNNGTLVSGTGNVYGGGEIGRVEWNTRVTIGELNASGTSAAPLIYGSVFGAGKGLETHGYSALVRGNSTVTVLGNAKVEHNVYGGGEKSTVGRYWVKGINNIDSEGNPVPGAPNAPSDLPDGMPYQQQSGGICSVTIQGSAQIGPDAGASTDAGHVFGAGKGANPHFDASTSEKMTKDNVLVAFEATTGKTAEDLYLEFLQTLALVTNSNVTINGSATVKGSVYGGSESGFVQHNTDVDILGGTIKGDAFGGGLGLASFAEAGKVKGNTDLTVSDDALVEGNVYGGGSLGDVGIIDKTDKKDGQLTYNYKWKQSDGVTANVAEYNIPSSTSIHDTSNNTGICKVTVSGGTIGLSSTSEPTKHGNVFGAGRGSSTTWWCEKAIAYATDVSVTKGTVYGNVYGGGEVGRVEDDAKVTIGAENGTDEFTISGSVFGAGAGLATHGYSALVRGNAEVTVQGKAQVDGSVYGGGEIASVGRFHVVGGLPRNPQAGGTCTVKILGNAKIGTSGTGHNVFGACKGVTPAYNNTQDDANRSKSMQLYENRPKNTDGSEKEVHKYWDYYETYGQDYEGQKFVWVYYETEDDYLDFLKTLALTSNTHVTIGGSSDVYGSVYGGGERGITLGGVDVNMTGGTVYEDVYGGGSLADSNTAMWDATNNTLHDYAELELIPGLSVVTGYYTDKSPEMLITTEDAKATGTKYYAIYKTNVNLTGGTIKGNAYGGGLGRKEYGTEGENGYVSPIEAMVYGDVKVELNNNNNGGTANGSVRGCAVTRVFGCNNLNGTPKGKVKVFVYATQNSEESIISDKTLGTYDVQAVYGGGNLAKYEPVDALLEYNETNKAKVDAARTEVIIDGCALTSIQQVYGGGNAASVPATYVLVERCYEIDEVFGGGNGADDYSLRNGANKVWYKNPGANVGYYDYTRLITDQDKDEDGNPIGTGSGTEADPYKNIDKENARTKVDRQNPDNHYMYGSGIATTEIKGGTIHTVYGGSNSKGNVRTKLSSSYSGMFDDCPMVINTTYGSGKNAESDGEVEVLSDCAKGISVMFGGAENADVDNDINLIITNGSSLQRVFGGNNTSGAINGSITVTIKEGGCEPIRIGELYAGGFLAPYSIYGYKKTNGVYDTEEVEYFDENDNTVKKKLQRIPLESASEDVTPKANPRINVISATRIDNIFGGGYQAKLVGSPHINVNMEPGRILAKYVKEDFVGEHKDTDGNVLWTGDHIVTEDGPEKGDGILAIGTIGNVYGGGNMADIVGNTYVEIGTGTEHNDAGELVAIRPVRNAATITGNVFGGGKGKADTFTCEKAMIGIADSPDKTIGNTHVTIANGTVGTLENGKLKEGTGNVYGGGEIGRVENNANVTLGIENGTGPDIRGCVFGAGAGVNTHGYSALVRGDATVLIQGNTKVGQSVYGGGEIASVGRYKVADAAYHAQHPDVEIGVPYSTNEGGICTVTIKGNAEIGPDNMKMVTDTGWPTDQGHVFGAGKGVLPYELTNTTDNRPRRMWRVKSTDTDWNSEWNDAFDGYADADKTVKYKDIWEYYDEEDKEPAYLKYIQSLALTTTTEVTIEGNAFVKGSVYGGSMNGHVQANTHVVIDGDCQIGNGDGVNRRYTTDEWASQSLAECASWPYGHDTGTTDENDNKIYEYLSYDVYDYQPGTTKPKPASDGHTYYGNVFGGGSGLFPYKQDPDWAVVKEALGNKSRKDLGYSDGVWLRSAGAVYGNTHVEIKGGHVLTSVYGGNECTDVKGTTTVEMSGGTLGVPRTPDEIKKHPVTCYLFGAGKGDQRINFNTWTNVEKAIVKITGGHIFGSVFGGGEDGHVLGDVEMTISGASTKIGTTGTSYVDGNIFGGGRGFSGDAQTAGTVGGDINMTISGGEILGSIYGGGRLASVGTEFTDAESPNYGNIVEDGEPIYYTQEDADAYNQENNLTEGMEDYKTTESIKIPATTHGHITININGGTIGGDFVKDQDGNLPEGAEHSGNVFGGSMGRLTLLNGNINPIWPKMAQVKETNVTISGDAVIKRNVYGGGEFGTVRDNATVNINGGRVNRDVYGGGYGSEDFETKTKITVKIPKEGVTNPTSASDYDDVSYVFTPMIFAGCVGQNTFVNIAGGKVRKNVYGGGEMASVGIMDCRVEIDNNATDPVYTEGSDKYVYEHFHSHLDETNGFALSWPFHFENAPGYFGATHVKVTGGRIGVAIGDTDINTDNGDVYGGGKGIAGEYKNYVYCANVGSTDVNINYTSGATTLDPAAYMSGGDCIAGAVYGGAENGHVMGDTKLTLNRGLIGHSMYGGGSGKGTFTTTLNKITGVTVKTDKAPTPTVTPPTQTETTYDAEIYSITAGKVFGNTNVIMNGGYVVRNVYGGGNLGSVGKGNYAGGTDDYSYYNNGARSGYGETLDGSLWDKSSDPSKAFMNSGVSNVTINGGTVGYIDFNDVSSYTYSGLPYGNVFGGCRGESAPNIGESPRYLYSPTFFSGYVNETNVTIGAANSSEGPKIWGSVYGGGMDGHVRRDATVTINSGEIGRAYNGDGSADDLAKIEWSQCGNVYGAGSGIGQYNYDFNYDGDYEDVVEYTNPETGRASTVKERDFSTSAGSVTRFTKVEVKGGKIHRNVYGGGSLSSVGAPKIPPTREDDPIRRNDDDKTTQGLQSLNEVIISGSTTTIGDASSYDANGNHVYGGFVFGASRGDETLSNPTSFASSVWTDVKVQGGTIYGDVYGGGEVGTVRQGTEVQLTGGVIGSVKNDKVVGGDVFGGGKGTSTVAADIGGDVLVELNKGVAVDDPGCVVDRIYGANNINGTPKGHVTVHVYATQNRDLATYVNIEDKKDVTSPEPPASDFDMTGVFGGGKSSDYVPAESDTKQSTEVIIDGCLTSIYEVYGGGYGASTPGTNVLINGTKIIDKVFGGGYGKKTTDFPDNPGANVGYRTVGKTLYGSHINDEEKIAIVQLNAGKVNSVFGGSNTLGDIRNGASITTLTSDDAEEGTGDPCDILEVGELYGGGNEAVMEGGAEIVLRCMPDSWIGEVYAGARKADVGNDVSLTITSGKFDQVFGGNKSKGKIDGYVEVNIEECPTCNTPVIIGELYGGGNEAPYTYSKIESDPDYPSPRVNVRAFTSIGTIYGGGKGKDAVVKGNPTVNVSVGMVDGGGQDYNGGTRSIDGKDVQLYAHDSGNIGVIGNIFGGGNAAEVNGNTNVFIGTEKYVKLDRIVPGETDVSNYYIRTGTSSNYEYTPVPRTKATAAGTYYQRNQAGTYTEVSVSAGDDVSGYYTRSGEGTEVSPFVYAPVSPAQSNTVYCLPVLGADIQGNVYGGGNAAKVTGHTNVVIGKKQE